MSQIQGFNHLKLALNQLVSAGDVHARLSAAIYQHLVHLSDFDVPSCLRSYIQLIKDKYTEDKEAINRLSEIEAEHESEFIVLLVFKWLESKII